MCGWAGEMEAGFYKSLPQSLLLCQVKASCADLCVSLVRVINTVSHYRICLGD